MRTLIASLFYLAFPSKDVMEITVVAKATSDAKMSETPIPTNI